MAFLLSAFISWILGVQIYQEVLNNDTIKSKKEPAQQVLLGRRIISNSFPYDIAKSRRASFSEVFLSVDSLRWPMIRAHCTPYSPAGNFLL